MHRTKIQHRGKRTGLTQPPAFGWVGSSEALLWPGCHQWHPAQESLPIPAPFLPNIDCSYKHLRVLSSSYPLYHHHWWPLATFFCYLKGFLAYQIVIYSFCWKQNICWKQAVSVSWETKYGMLTFAKVKSLCEWQKLSMYRPSPLTKCQWTQYLLDGLFATNAYIHLLCRGTLLVPGVCLIVSYSKIVPGAEKCCVFFSWMLLIKASWTRRLWGNAGLLRWQSWLGGCLVPGAGWKSCVSGGFR